MKLYYMTDEYFAKRMLAENRVKISRFHEFNDPFELASFQAGTPFLKKIHEWVTEDWSVRGAVCLSDNYESPVMWAHYAKKHQGVCLGFEVPDGSDHVMKMIYKPDRILLNIDFDKPDFGLANSSLGLDVATTKFDEWAYEREYRIFHFLDTSAENGMHFYGFDDELMLTDVIVGARCDTPLQDFADLVHDNPSLVTVSKATLASNRFAIKINLQVNAVDVSPYGRSTR